MQLSAFGSLHERTYKDHFYSMLDVSDFIVMIVTYPDNYSELERHFCFLLEILKQ